VVPIKTSIEDLQRVLSFLGRQIGWVDPARIEKTLGALDDRKVGAMVEFGLIVRDGKNIRATDRGQLFNTDAEQALREVLHSVDLYRSTLEWVHYGARSDVTSAEVGQYWESSHKDTIGGLSGATLGYGAVTFGRVIDGAGMGTFKLGRGGKETRISFDLSIVDSLVNGEGREHDQLAEDIAGSGDAAAMSEPPIADQAPSNVALTTPPARTVAPAPVVSVATSPSVHVNVEIHIAADATADTVREIFKNMARYVLDKNIDDDHK
jgi:hypothetical protein